MLLVVVWCCLWLVVVSPCWPLLANVGGRWHFVGLCWPVLVVLLLAGVLWLLSVVGWFGLAVAVQWLPPLIVVVLVVVVM